MVSRRQRDVLQKVLGGRSDANIRFTELTGLLHALGFASRIRGDHHIFWKDGIAEIINLQPRGAAAKPYQVRQVRSILLKHSIGLDDD